MTVPPKLEGGKLDTQSVIRQVRDHRHCEEPTGPAFGGPDDKLRDEAIHSFFSWHDGLLRGACHRARIRATRRLAMTAWSILPALTPTFRYSRTPAWPGRRARR